MTLANTLVKTLINKVDSSEDQTAVVTKIKNKWYGQTFSLLYRDIILLANFFYEEKVSVEKKIIILSSNTPDFYKFDFACQALGIKTYVLPPSSNSEFIEHIMNTESISFIGITSDEFYPLVKNINYKKIISTVELRSKNAKTIDLPSIFKKNKKTDLDIWFKEEAFKVDENEIYTYTVFQSSNSNDYELIPTTHKQTISTLNDVHFALKNSIEENNEWILSYIHPWNFHGRMEFYSIFIFGWMQHYSDGLEAMPVELKEVNPSIIIANPHLLNLMYSIAKQNNPIKYFLLSKLNFNPIKNLFGWRIKFIISSGSYLNLYVRNFFNDFNLKVIEAYGIKEASGPISMSSIDDFKLGSLGKPLREVIIKISSKNEILVKSEKISHFPHSTDKDGWFHTGDIGYLDEEGYLFVTDIKTEKITLNSGEIIYPRQIENQFFKSSAIEHIVIYGNKKDYLVAIISPKKEKLISFAKKNKLFYRDYIDLVTSKRVKEFYDLEIESINRTLKPEEQIRRYILSSNEFSVKTGELSRGFNIKRKYIIKKFKNDLEKLYTYESVIIDENS